MHRFQITVFREVGAFLTAIMFLRSSVLSFDAYFVYMAEEEASFLYNLRPVILSNE